jgi:hypothetical protein
LVGVPEVPVVLFVVLGISKRNNMPFESKAQQRFMFAKHPRIAKRWAGETSDIKALPEKKKEEKTASEIADEVLAKITRG